LSWKLQFQTPNFVIWHDSTNKLLYVAVGHSKDHDSRVYARRMTNDPKESNNWIIVDVPSHQTEFSSTFSATTVTC
jgi:hypothetical protein